MKQIPMFLRLPPASGIPFSGFDFAKIQSREEVAVRINKFIEECNKSDYLNVAFITAEWGEGKTDAYERYLKKVIGDKHHQYLVSTSTICDRLSYLDKSPGVKAAKFLAAILSAVHDELKARGEELDREELWNLTGYSEDPLGYCKTILENHFRDNDQNRIFIFIDEFEEILAMSEDIQKSVLSGLKEIINGQLSDIREGGKFAGRLHLIVACTPYAYNRIREDPELFQIFGAISSRITANLIGLPQLTKMEGYQFLVDLMKFCYGGNLPSIMPIASGGILSSLLTISQRNPRALVQLLRDVFSFAGRDSVMKQIDYDLLITALQNKDISVYGGSTKCISPDLYQTLHSRLHSIPKAKQSEKLVDLLIGELRPFGLSEIESRIGLDKKELSDCTNQINLEGQKLGITQVIGKFYPLRNDKSVEDLIATLKPTQNEIQLVTGKIRLIELLDELVWEDINSDGKIHQLILLPDEPQKFGTIFGLNEEDSNLLYSNIKRLFDDNPRTRLYMLSKEMVMQIFPSPIWNLIDFVKQREKRLELWRETVRRKVELQTQLNVIMREIISISGNIRIEERGKIPNLLYSSDQGKIISIPCILQSFLRAVSRSDVEEIQRRARSLGAKLVIITHTSDIDGEAQKITSSNFEFVTIPLKPIQAQQLLVGKLAIDKGVEINQRLYQLKQKEAYQQLDIRQHFEHWLERGRNEGIVISDLYKEKTTDADLGKACRIFVNLNGRKNSDAYREYETLNNLRVFGYPSEFSAYDFESEDELHRLRKILIKNGFLDASDEVSYIDTAVEKRVLKLVRERSLSLQELKEQFVMLSANVDILEQVYIPILIQKGLIKEKNQQFTIVSLEDTRAAIEKAFGEYIKKCDDYLSSDRASFTHVCVSKERRDNIVTLSDFISIVREVYSQLASSEGAQYLRVARLIQQLIDYSRTALEENFNIAYQASRDLVRKCEDDLNSISVICNNILDEYNSYSKTKYSIADLTDVQTAQEKIRILNSIMDTTYTKDELRKGLIEERRVAQSKDELPFFYRKYGDKSSFSEEGHRVNYYSFKFLKLRITAGTFEKILDQQRENLLRVQKEIEAISVLRSGIDSKLLMQKIQESYPITNDMLKLINTLKARPLEAAAPGKLMLEDISNFFQQTNTYLQQLSGKVIRLIDQISIIKENEKTIIIELQDQERQLKPLHFFVEGVTVYETQFQPLKNDYETLSFEYSNLKKFSAAVHPGSDDFEAHLMTVSSKLVSIATDLKNLRRMKDSLQQEIINAITAERIKFQRFLSALNNEAKTETLKKFVDTTFEGLLNQCNFTQENVTTTMQDVIKNVIALRKELYVKTEKENILPREQSEMLYEIIQHLPESGYGDFLQITEKVSAKLKKSKAEVFSLILKFVEDNILKIGLGYP